MSSSGEVETCTKHFTYLHLPFYTAHFTFSFVRVKLRVWGYVLEYEFELGLDLGQNNLKKLIKIFR